MQLAKVKYQNAHFHLFHPPVYSELLQTPDSPYLLSLLILTRSLFILQPPDLAPGSQLPQAMEIADSLLKVNVNMVGQSSQNTLSIRAVAWESYSRKQTSFFGTIGCPAVPFSSSTQVKLEKTEVVG